MLRLANHSLALIPLASLHKPAVAAHAHLLKLHDVGVHEHPVVEDLPLHILGDLPPAQYIGQLSLNWQSESNMHSPKKGFGAVGQEARSATDLLASFDILDGTLLVCGLVHSELYKSERAAIKIFQLHDTRLLYKRSSAGKAVSLEGKAPPSCLDLALCPVLRGLLRLTF